MRSLSSGEIPNDMANAYQRFLGDRRTPTPKELNKEYCQEESRAYTESQMLTSPRQRAFFERVMPIEWCHQRYPKVYAKS